MDDREKALSGGVWSPTSQMFNLEAENQALRSALRTPLAFDEDAVHPDNREWRRAVKAAEKVLGDG